MSSDLVAMPAVRPARVLRALTTAFLLFFGLGVSLPILADGPETEELQNTIRWTTASELDNFGFDIKRSDTADGPFETVNAQPIEGQGTTDEPTDYAFEDRTIDPCRTYFYYVESISMSGEREHFTPIGQAPPKLPPDDERCRSSAEDSDRPEKPRAAAQGL